MNTLIYIYIYICIISYSSQRETRMSILVFILKEKAHDRLGMSGCQFY